MKRFILGRLLFDVKTASYCTVKGDHIGQLLLDENNLTRKRVQSVVLSALLFYATFT